MRRRAALLALAFAASIGSACAGQTGKILSLNLCTDQLLVDLAAPERIAGLSPYARDGARSWTAGRIGNLPTLSGTAEEVLVLRPALVVSSRYMKRETRAMIAGRGIALAEFDDPATIADARAQILAMGQLIGEEPKARIRLTEFDAALAELKAAALATPLRILPLARRGWVAGSETLLADLLRHAGLAHAAGELGFSAGGFASLEQVIVLAPDAILMGGAPDFAEDQGQVKLLHPALARQFPPERQILLPENLTVCGGPALIEGMRHLAREIRRISALTPRKKSL